MLQNNAWTGFLFLIGIFYNFWIMGVGAIAGTIISTISAKLFKYPKEDIENGLYGFNGTLVGIAVLFFFELNIYTVIAIIFGSILSTIIMHEMKKKIPAYTAPFVISTWIIILGIKFLNLAPFISSTISQASSLDIFSATTMGFGQVMFQGSVITGLIFLFAIFVNSKLSAFYALYGSLLGIAFALILSLPLNMIGIGLFGYNAILCGIAFESIKFKKFIFATIAILLSVLVSFWMGDIGIITLTAPFVISTWIVLLIRHFLKK